VGEIRDLETAQIAVQASLTGHLVFSTLHTNDAPSSIARLLDLGLEPFLITATLEAIVAQRLVRKICPTARRSSSPRESS
jgi:type II secretory ATPase GspE/PulE/Tfp pilus assembly ATPase PilB-like protein